VKGTKKRVVWVYMRRSGDQQHESLGRQEDEITADDVVSKAHEVVRPFFIDDAVSGTLSLEQRKGGAKLLAAVRAYEPRPGVEQVIVIDDVSRLSREKNPYTVGAFLGPCFDKAIAVYFRRDRLWSTDPMFEVMFSLHRRRAADFSADLSGKVFEGQLRKAQQKNAHVGGKADYGYDRILCDVDGTPLRRYVVTDDLYLHCYDVDGTEEIQDPLPPRVKKAGGPLGPAGIGKSLGQYIVLAKTIVKQRAEAIDLCFKGILAGVVPMTIARDLIARGIPSPGGKGWRGDTVVRLVKNSIYYGQDYFNVRSRSAFSGVRRGEDGFLHRVASDDAIRTAVKNGRSVPREHWVVKEFDAELAYVTKDVADRCRAILISRRPYNRGGEYCDRIRTSRHLLGGLIVCGHCGRKMQATKRAGGKPVLFACQTNKHEPDKCLWKSIHASKLDAYVLDLAESLLLEQPIENIRAEIGSVLDSREKEAPAEDPAPKIRAQIAALEAKAKTLWSRFESPRTRRELLDDIQDQIVAAKGEKAALETKLAELESAKPKKAIELTADFYLDRVREIRAGLESADPAQRKTAIRAIVGEIRLTFEKNKAWRYRADPAFVLKKGKLSFAKDELGIGSMASA
jgi:DNA invertase Pin-like site-specific DNA recombinase